MSPNVLCVIQARLGSTRLPRKALELIGEHPIIRHVVRRARQIEGLSGIVVATPSRVDADEIAAVLPRVIPVVSYSGIAEPDVLSRFAAVCAHRMPDVVMRITADCPFLDPRIAEQVLALYHASHCDYASNIAEGYVDGEDVEVFSRQALEEAHRMATEHSDREHVTLYIRRHLRCVTLPSSGVGGKTSIDTMEDLLKAREWAA
jgi:spore coat polysaccharide biosynthesis protein SpsF